MIGPKVSLALLLVSTFVLNLLAAQTALAFEAKNTTAFTCVNVGANKGGFKDPHCDEKTEPNKGEYAHVSIPLFVETELEVTNSGTQNATKESTPAVFKGEAFGVKLEIACTQAEDAAVVIEKKVLRAAAIHNTEGIPAKAHSVEGQITIRFSSCKVEKPVGCTIKEPFESETLVIRSVEGLEGKGEMGVEFRQNAAETFVVFNIKAVEGKICLLPAKIEVTGAAIATGTPGPSTEHTGATLKFTNAMTGKTLKFAGNPAEFSTSFTARMAGSGNPIALTTVT
jgi:hypothetical protein